MTNIYIYYEEPRQDIDINLHYLLWIDLSNIVMGEDGEKVEIEMLSKDYNENWICIWKNGYVEDVTERARKIGII